MKGVRPLTQRTVAAILASEASAKVPERQPFFAVEWVCAGGRGTPRFRDHLSDSEVPRIVDR